MRRYTWLPRAMIVAASFVLMPACGGADESSSDAETEENVDVEDSALKACPAGYHRSCFMYCGDSGCYEKCRCLRFSP